MMVAVFRFAILILAVRRSLAACTSSADCLLNGDCVSESCVCDPGWVGETCGILDLLPCEPLQSYVAPNGTSSWGIAITKDKATGLWHGFVSEFANKCKLNSWVTNSYLNHIVASKPEGPWRQAGTAVDIWSHNPKLVYSNIDKTWLLFHIGDGTASRAPEVCNNTKNVRSISGAAPKYGSSRAGQKSASWAAPFVIHHASSLDGPWHRAPQMHVHASPAASMTFYPNTTNVPLNVSACSGPSGSIIIYERSDYGTGKLRVPLAMFAANKNRGGRLAWDACRSGLTFDNGHAVQGPSGSMIGAVALQADKRYAIRPGSPCAASFDYPASEIHLLSEISASDGVVDLEGKGEVNYFEVTERFKHAAPGFCVIGKFDKPQSCRSACEDRPHCSSYTWMGEGDQRCALRQDEHWEPVQAEGFVSGRPWSYYGDNPAPWINPTTGEVRVLYRSDSNGGDERGYHVASLIGQLSAPHWTGNYTPLTKFDGPVSAPHYPIEENEDPFLWRSRRGWHALFHACTWTDSRGAHFPAAKWAGRYAFSADDGMTWNFSPVPAYNASIRFANGTVKVFSRMERPFLLFDENGAPTHLFNGVQPVDWDDYTFTLMHRIRAKRDAVTQMFI